MRPENIGSRIVPPVILAISLLWIYLATIAPGLTWANSGSDGGDLITATAIGGVAHPTGYPVYMLLARGFQLLPVGSLAFRTNLMSAIFAVLAALMVYLIVVRSVCTGAKPYPSYLAGLGAGYASGLAPLMWSQAVITEVYTLHAFFVALILCLISIPRKSTRMDCFKGIVYGLAAGNHLTSLIIIPGAMLASCMDRVSSITDTQDALRMGNKYLFAWKSMLRQILWMTLGLSVYFILPLRATTQPVVNWGNPVTLKGFWWLASGSIYRTYYLQDSWVHIWPRVQAGISLFLQQFGILGIGLGFLGLVFTFQASRLKNLILWIALAFFVVTIVYQSEDAYVYFIPVCIAFSIWIGFGLGYISNQLSKWNLLWTLGFGTILAIIFAFGVVLNWHHVDASQDNRAEVFGKQVLRVAPENAMIFAEGDQAVFALWYFHFALGQRPDVSIIASELLHWDWYHDSLKHAYPHMNLSTLFPWPSTVIDENPKRPVCFVSYKDDLEMTCDE